MTDRLFELFCFSLTDEKSSHSDSNVNYLGNVLQERPKSFAFLLSGLRSDWRRLFVVMFMILLTVSFSLRDFVNCIINSNNIKKKSVSNVFVYNTLQELYIKSRKILSLTDFINDHYATRMRSSFLFFLFRLGRCWFFFRFLLFLRFVFSLLNAMPRFFQMAYFVN